MTATSPKTGIKRRNYGKGHGYTIDGQKAVGVTTALKALPKDLTRWAARTVAEYVADNTRSVLDMLQHGGAEPTVGFLSQLPFQKRNEAAVRGTEIHTLAEQVMDGQEVAVPPALEGYIESYIRFCDEWQPTPVLNEAVCASRKHLVAGTLDSVADIPALGRVLVDYKSGRGIYGEMALQASGYRYMDVYLDAEGNEQPMPELDGAYVLHLSPDGYELIPLDAGPETYETFLLAVALYRRAIQEHQGVKKLNMLIGEPLAPPAREAA